MIKGLKKESATELYYYKNGKKVLGKNELMLGNCTGLSRRQFLRPILHGSIGVYWQSFLLGKRKRLHIESHLLCLRQEPYEAPLFLLVRAAKCQKNLF